MAPCASRSPSTRRPDALPVALLALALWTASSPARADAAGDTAAEALVEAARVHYDEAAATEPGFTLLTRTESGDSEPCVGRFSVLGGATRTETRFEGLLSEFGFVAVSTGLRSSLWRISGHIVERGDPAISTGGEVLTRWFDHPAVAAGSVSVVAEEVVSGRRCHVVQLETTRVAQRPAYRLPGGSTAQVEALLEERDLDLALAQVSRAGGAEALSPQEWAEERAAGRAPTVTKLWVFDRSRDAVIAGRSPRGNVVPKLSMQRPVDSITRLWVDAEHHQLVQLEGLVFGATEEPGTVTVTLADFLDRAWTWPRTLRVSVDGETTLEVTTTEVLDEPLVAALFEPASVTAELEMGVQAANEAEIRRLMTDATFKHGGLDPARDLVFKPDDLVDSLELTDGDVVADIGAGTGYFTFRLANAVGPSGRVYAVDVNTHVLDALDARMRGEGDAGGAGKNKIQDDLLIVQLPGDEKSPEREDVCPFRNVVVHINDFEGLALPVESLDLAFLCASGLVRYHHLSPTNTRMMESIFRTTKPGGEFVVIERQPQGRDVTIQALGLAAVQVGPLGSPDAPAGLVDSYPTGLDEIIRANGRAVGFEVVRSVDLVESHAFVVFRRPVE